MQDDHGNNSQDTGLFRASMADPFDQSRSTFPDHFSANAAGYAIYRPAYPGAFVAEIAALAPRRTLAWDCATGNGQAARLLASHFDRVIATDASAEQIDNAVPHSRVQYRVGREDSSGAERRSVDDVTVSTALHWLDLEIGFRDLAFPFEERPFGERSMTGEVVARAIRRICRYLVCGCQVET